MKTYQDFLREHQTAHPFEVNARLGLFVRAYEEHREHLGRPLRILDVGCGTNPALARFVTAGDTYHGVDFYETPEARLDAYTSLDLNSTRLTDALPGASFDVVYCGELIEHLFNPDALLREIRQLLSDDGILVLSTPNLGYWVNRLLLLVGISPLYLENSAEVKLGRRLVRLGQGNHTEGHIRLFTYRALLEFVARAGFNVVSVTPTYTWNFPIDRVVARVSRSLAPTNVLVLRAARGDAVP